MKKYLELLLERVTAANLDVNSKVPTDKYIIADLIHEVATMMEADPAHDEHDIRAFRDKAHDFLVEMK